MPEEHPVEYHTERDFLIGLFEILVIIAALIFLPILLGENHERPYLRESQPTDYQSVPQ